MRVSSDDRCRVQSRELFKPNTRYQGEVSADGSIRLVELVEKEVPIIQPVRINGRLRPPPGFRPSRAVIAAAIRADRNAR